MSVKRDRTVYLAGPKKGKPRPSSGTRERKRQGRLSDKWREENKLLDELVQQIEEEELDDAKEELMIDVEASGELKKFRLGRGYRESLDGPTVYSLYDEEESEWLNKLVVVSTVDVSSGRRWFREEYPESWAEKYKKREMVGAAKRSGGDYGKVFVEYRGKWYEAKEER
jgi:hypothetical protein